MYIATHSTDKLSKIGAKIKPQVLHQGDRMLK